MSKRRRRWCCGCRNAVVAGVAACESLLVAVPLVSKEGEVVLETVDFSQGDMPKDEYKKRYGELIDRLVVLQQRARQKGVGLVVLFEGWGGAGKGSRISDLMYNLDARATSVHVTENFDTAQAHEFAGRKQGVGGFFPFMQEFWRALGERGTITFYDRGWYTSAMQRVLYDLFGSLSLPKDAAKRMGKESVRGKAASRVAPYAASIADFEQQITDDGYTLVKFFVHMTKQGQKKRLEHLRENPATAWRVSDDKLARIGKYDEAYVVYDRLLEGSDFGFAPWTLLNGECKRRTNIAVAETLVRALEEALRFAEADVVGQPAQAADVEMGDSPSALSGIEGGEAVAGGAPSEVPAMGDVSAGQGESSMLASSRFELAMPFPSLGEVDHALSLDEETYRKRLKKLQKKLFALESEMYQQRVPLIVMYEGWDAAGKGGNIKRVAQALDARAYTIFPSPAPTRTELAHPHLWRYWTRLPKAGHVGIYDRSWYGRVLVERVEGFASPEQWRRAYDEINAFERDLVQWGAVLLKFWVEVSQDEQLRRFEARQADPAKQWKITDEDWRNREKYPLYKEAAEDMFRSTSTVCAPWIILESDDKRYARIKALENIVAALEQRLE